MNIKEEYKQQYDKLFKSHNNLELVTRRYALPEFVNEDLILFIGINPSYTEKDRNFELNNTPKEPSEFGFFYNNHSASYFKKFKEIGEETKLGWTHFDIFGIRETKQDKLKNILKNKQYEQFINQHLELTKEILERSNPKLIIVENTLSRDILKNPAYLGYSFEFSEVLGTPVITNEDSNLKGKAVFFTSMLTGQRALDKGSYRRLIWHINKLNEWQNI